MTPVEINAAIAGQCGWVAVRMYRASQTQITPVGYGPDDPFPHDKGEQRVPDYYGDLNACAKFEKTLSPDEWRQYMPMLHEVCGRCVQYVVGAAASQRSEAFLRVKGLWKE